MEESLPVLNVNALNESLKLLQTSLNKACGSGAFTLDEAHLVKIALNNMGSCVTTLDKYQEYTLKRVESDKNNDASSRDTESMSSVN